MLQYRLHGSIDIIEEIRFKTCILVPLIRYPEVEEEYVIAISQELSDHAVLFCKIQYAWLIDMGVDRTPLSPNNPRPLPL